MTSRADDRLILTTQTIQERSVRTSRLQQVHKQIGRQDGLADWCATYSGQRHTPGANGSPDIALGEVHTARILKFGRRGRRLFLIKEVIITGIVTGVEEELSSMIRDRLRSVLRQLRCESRRPAYRIVIQP